MLLLELGFGLGVSPEADYPDLPAGGYYLRFTRRALEDLRAGGCDPGSPRAVECVTPWAAVVEEFVEQRTESPGSTGGYLARVGRPDVAPLHGPAGARACTWFDADQGVCWFLGFSPEHDYRVFETRAANDELFPDEDDEVAFELWRENLDFNTLVRPGLLLLADQVFTEPGAVRRATLGLVLRAEATAEVIFADGVAFGDVWLSLKLPFDAARSLRDWPGPRLAEVLCAHLGADGFDVAETFPRPDGDDPRMIDHASEVVYVFRGVVQR